MAIGDVNLSERSAGRIAGIYGLFGGLWILFSDKILGVMVRAPQQITILQTFKGWFYILVTAVLVYLLVRNMEKKLNSSLNALMDKNTELQIEITERHQVERERQKLIDQLEIQNSELERYTYTVSHDLKTPLVTFKGFLGLLELDLSKNDTEKIKTDLLHMNTAADTMLKLLKALLELSRIGRVVNPPEPIPLCELVSEVVQLNNAIIAERNIHVEIDPNLPVAKGDRVRLQEVFQNLIDNAVCFMGEQREPCITIGIRHQEGEDMIFVQDNGMGIDARYQEKVFGLFERLDAGGKGAGVGLAIVKRIIEVHGGRIWVESEGRGKGSTFCFTLPVTSIQRVA